MASTRKDINRILNYPEDSAGSLITIEYLELKKSMTVAAALERIRERGQDVDDISYAYIVDKTRTIVGYIELKTLLLASPEEKVESLMEMDVISVKVDEMKTTADKKVLIAEVTTLLTERNKKCKILKHHVIYYIFYSSNNKLHNNGKYN